MGLNETIIEKATTHIGTPYVWGGESVTEGGYDCSGFVYVVLNESGIKVKRTTAQGYFNLCKENTCEGKEVAGALLFFGKSTKNITHVAISLGNGKMIESRGSKSNTKAKPGKGVCISNISRRRDLVAVRLAFKQTSTIKKPVVALPTLRQGNMGTDVRNLQADLNFLFSANLVLDGHFGPATRRALLKFQSATGLVADGIYGPHSYRTMRNLIDSK